MAATQAKSAAEGAITDIVLPAARRSARSLPPNRDRRRTCSRRLSGAQASRQHIRKPAEQIDGVNEAPGTGMKISAGARTSRAAVIRFGRRFKAPPAVFSLFAIDFPMPSFSSFSVCALRSRIFYHDFRIAKSSSAFDCRAPQFALYFP